MMIQLTAPAISAIYAGILAIAAVVLSLNVSRLRASANIWLGDNGNDALIRARWAHHQIIEVSPIFLIVLTAWESLGGNATSVVWTGVVFVVGRVIHLYGAFKMPPKNPARALGGTLSLLAILGAAIGSLVLGLG